MEAGWKDGKARLVLEIIGAVFLAGSLLANFLQWETSKSQLEAARGQLAEAQKANETSREQVRQAQIANERAKEALDDTRKARDEDRILHEKERADIQKKLDDFAQKTERVRTQMQYATSNFISNFDSAVTISQKMPLDNLKFQDLKSLSQNIIDQRKHLRDISESVQSDMVVIYNAVDSNISALITEISAASPNISRIKELLRLIGNAKETIVGNVVQARESALHALGCNERAYADALPHR